MKFRYNRLKFSVSKKWEDFTWLSGDIENFKKLKCKNFVTFIYRRVGTV